MAITTIDDKYLTNIATAIRQKSGVEDTFKPSEMASAIKDISGGNPILQDIVVNPSTSEQTITPSVDYDGINQVKVNAVTSSIDSDIKPENIKKGINILGVDGTIEDKPAEPTLQNKTVNPTTGKQVISADGGYDGLGNVTINAVTSSIDSNIKADNIKQGVSILGVEGSLDTGQVIVQKYKPKYISFWSSNLTDMRDETRMLDTSLLTTMNYMFSSCSKLLYVDCSEWNTPNVTSLNSFFNSCSNLLSIGDLSHFDTSKVTDMNGAFSNCNALDIKSANISEWDTSNVKDLGSMFYGCKNFGYDIKLNWNTEKVTSMSYMFCNCSKLTEIDLSTFTGSSLTSTGNMFEGCTSLRKIDIRNLDITKVGSRSQMFRNVPTTCLIIVKDEDNKTAVNSIIGGANQNIKTLAEYQAEGGV